MCASMPVVWMCLCQFIACAEICKCVFLCSCYDPYLCVHISWCKCLFVCVTYRVITRARVPFCACVRVCMHVRDLPLWARIRAQGRSRLRQVQSPHWPGSTGSWWSSTCAGCTAPCPGASCMRWLSGSPTAQTATEPLLSRPADTNHTHIHIRTHCTQSASSLFQQKCFQLVSIKARLPRKACD